MPELDPFEVRLAAAVHAFADHAETSVDATAVAARAVGRRRTGAFAWLWSPLPVPAAILVTLALMFALLAWSVQVGGPLGPRALVVPLATPTSTPAPAPTQTAAATPTDGEGDEAVTGTQAVEVVTYGTTVLVGEFTQMRGVVATTVDTMNDPRVTGTGTIHGENDFYGSVGPQWGTYRLENAGGAWEGTWTGALWEGGNVSSVSAWLVGRGAYEGYTYYMHARGTKVDGIIFQGSSPTPAATSGPAATPSLTAGSTPTPVRPSGGAAAHVVGTEMVSVATLGTRGQVGGVVQVRGQVVTSTDTMNDPRVNGAGTIQANVDSYGAVATQWGTYRLENTGGAWEGTWTGALWDNQGITDVTGWLVGSGAYEGMTYRFHVRGSDILEVDGIIYPGRPPAP